MQGQATAPFRPPCRRENSPALPNARGDNTSFWRYVCPLFRSERPCTNPTTHSRVLDLLPRRIPGLQKLHNADLKGAPPFSVESRSLKSFPKLQIGHRRRPLWGQGVCEIVTWLTALSSVQAPRKCPVTVAPDSQVNGIAGEALKLLWHDRPTNCTGESSLDATFCIADAVASETCSTPLHI